MLRRLFQLMLVGSVLATLAAWIISVEMAETWVFTRTRDAASALAARERLWLIRAVAPILAIGAWLGSASLAANRAVAPRVGSRVSGRHMPVRRATASTRVRSVVCRVTIAAWLLLSLVHWEAGARKAIHEWPVYRWTTGERVLPNMSSSNRDVIRCLEEATEEDARILCLSDQTLYFVSYYAWPRKVLHRTHPDSEFVVPQEGLSQRRAAYRLTDFTADQVADWRRTTCWNTTPVRSTSIRTRSSTIRG